MGELVNNLLKNYILMLQSKCMQLSGRAGFGLLPGNYPRHHQPCQEDQRRQTQAVGGKEPRITVSDNQTPTKGGTYFFSFGFKCRNNQILHFIIAEQASGRRCYFGTEFYRLCNLPP